jgi:hypothetical protein
MQEEIHIPITKKEKKILHISEKYLVRKFERKEKPLGFLLIVVREANLPFYNRKEKRSRRRARSCADPATAAVFRAIS